MFNQLSVDGIFNEMLPQLIKEKPDVVKRINAVIGVKLTGQSEETFTIDLKDNPGVRQGLENDTKCLVTVDKNVLEDLIRQGKVKPWLNAYKSKKITAKGHLPTIIKVERLASGLLKE